MIMIKTLCSIQKSQLRNKHRIFLCLWGYELHFVVRRIHASSQELVTLFVGSCLTDWGGVGGATYCHYLSPVIMKLGMHTKDMFQTYFPWVLVHCLQNKVALNVHWH